MTEPCQCTEPGYCPRMKMWMGKRLLFHCQTDERRRAIWDATAAAKLTGARPPIELPCKHLGPPTGETMVCPSCAGTVKVKLMACEVYGQCSTHKQLDNGVQCCVGCKDYAAREEPEKPPAVPSTNGNGLPAMPSHKSYKWVYGLTTCPVRRDDLLPRTLASLRVAGFDRPRLFIDGPTNREAVWWEEKYGLEVTARHPTIRTFGNWVLALAELYIRDPWADRYAIFQDDFVTYHNLRQYLDSCKYPERGYWNLYTMPSNQSMFPMEGQTGRQRFGWIESRELNSGAGFQTGRGAVALVFNQEAVVTLLTQKHMVERPQDVQKGWRAVDGGIVTAMNKAGWREMVHNPSLVQHTGEVSSMRNKPQMLAQSFVGEGFNALELLKG